MIFVCTRTRKIQQGVVCPQVSVAVLLDNFITASASIDQEKKAAAIEEVCALESLPVPLQLSGGRDVGKGGRGVCGRG